VRPAFDQPVATVDEKRDGPAGRSPRPHERPHPEGGPVIELCIHAANVFYLASFLGRDMLWLRALTCAGLALGVVFFACQPTPMYGPAAWHVAFLAINAVQILRLIAERRQLRLSDEQARLAEARFGDLSRDQLLTLLTRVAHDGAGELRGPHAPEDLPLRQDQAILRDLAFRHLTRQEIVILLTRRLWHDLRMRELDRWRWRRRRDPGAGRGRRRAEPAGGPSTP
jgi:hypothetical protein